MKAVFGLLNLTAGACCSTARTSPAAAAEGRAPRRLLCAADRQCLSQPVGRGKPRDGRLCAQRRLPARLREIYELFPPLAEKKQQPAGTLSGGQRQMVAMGKALMLEPKILLLDEPTAGLSPKFRGEIFQVVRDINATGVPILMVEQNAKQALNIADRGYVLVDGQNRIDDSGQALLATARSPRCSSAGAAMAAEKARQRGRRGMMDFLSFHLIPGLVLGSIYALGAIGISLTFGILRFANFAHGEIMTLGAYITLSLIWITGWHPIALLPIAMALTLGRRAGHRPGVLQAVPEQPGDHPGDRLLRHDADGPFGHPVQLGRAIAIGQSGHSIPLRVL